MSVYVVFDLEWNQSPEGKEHSIAEFPFEIIEIGAVKMNERLQIISEYHRLVTPQVYTQLHYRISQVTHLHMSELRREGRPFPEVAREFLKWCGEDASFCTWGSMDLTELQRNMKYHGMGNPFPRPLLYYDVQKLYALQTGAGKEKPSLDHAVDDLGILEDRPFHRALDDAYYTGKVMQELDMGTWQPFVSVDYFRLPATPPEEIRLTFPTYMKYVSREFPSKEEALEDRGVTEMVCKDCRRMLRKKCQWFSVNSKQCLCLAVCPEHGFVRGKIRFRKAEGEAVYVVKTMKPVGEEEAARVFEKREEQRKRKRERERERRVNKAENER